MDAVFHVHDADVSTLIEVRWCLRVVGAVISSGRRGEEGKGREVERGRKEEERGGRRVR